ncbi:MAG: Proteasome-activating nucleotidase [Candidatus Heimdallarchaeota archaeon LC_3]|nr:MAG: Proteasome-activating nucleotidase [Candidatus Heimdallarchaeota archaeon LC_3]
MAFTPSNPSSAPDELVQKLETKNQLLERKLRLANNELVQLREEMKTLSTLPLQVGTVQDIIIDNDNNYALVMIRGSNQLFRVSYSDEKFPDGKLSPGVLVTLHPKTLAIIGTLQESEDTYVRAMEVLKKPDITFDMIGGLSDEIQLVVESIELSLNKPEVFDELGVIPPKGILLYGPPGTGKTMIAKALAHETKATFIGLAAPELAQKFIGDGARLVREIFHFARKNAPAIIFIDEIDAIAMRRSDLPTEGNTEIHRTFLQLLAELDGFNERGNIKFVAATNRPDVLDKAITRPGRFDRKIEIGIPSESERVDIFKIHTRKMKTSDIDYLVLSKETKGFNGAEIRAVCTEAGLLAIRCHKKQIDMGDMLSAITKVKKKTKQEKIFLDYR